MPGDGYFKLFNGGDEDFQWWESEIISCKKYNWLPHFHDFSALNAVSGDKWSTEELRASIEIYFEMLNFQRRGKSFIKTRYYDELSKRFNRSTKAFEYRMQNISYVLSLMGREWLSGLRPAKNVGARMAAEIENLIFEIEGRQGIATSFDELVVLGEMSKASLPVPSGVPEPMTISSTITQYKRSLEVKAWVLKKADGMCECCANAAPFSRVDGFAYLEFIMLGSWLMVGLMP